MSLEDAWDNIRHFLTVRLFVICATGDGAGDDCVHDKIQKFNKNSNQSVLIVWDSTDMEDLIEDADKDTGLDNDSLGLQ
ncbi:hypothetical protein B0H13DRAFT_2370577 [Mycena leptocephala]|nr:hypothetical protein B0H13DRAFT_2370577 [Mycena leptocephala]